MRARTVSGVDDLTVTDVPAAQRYEAIAGGQLVGFLDYRRRADVVVAQHTEVLPGFEGQGVGGALVRGLLDDARLRGSEVVARCPFVRSWLPHHPEYADLIRAE